jgi:hypothetical protein
MGTTNISEISEISNKTTDTYYMYVWDNAHEGRYTPFDNDQWQYPDEGKWLTIGPRAHLRADDCGIPDGGKSAGKDRCRVIFKAHGDEQKLQGDPGRGLRMNRVGLGNGQDALIYGDHSSGETILSHDLPTSTHQNCLLLIDQDGDGKDRVRLMVRDQAKSGEARTQEAFEAMGAVLGDLVKLGVGIATAVA